MPTIDEQIAFIEDNAGMWKSLQDLKLEDLQARTVTRTIRGDGTYFTTVRGRDQMLSWISHKNTWFYDTEYIDTSPDLKQSLIETLKELQQLKSLLQRFTELQADIIIRNECWQPQGTAALPTLTQNQWDEWVAIETAQLKINNKGENK